MNTEDIARVARVAWTAGIVEGEGCFQTSGASTMYIQVGMTDKDIIDRLHAYWGGTVSKRNYSDRPWQPLWTWTLTPKNGALELTEAILPYLGQRRMVKAKECLAHALNNPRTERREKARVMVRLLLLKGKGPTEIASSLGLSRSYVQKLKAEISDLDSTYARMDT